MSPFSLLPAKPPLQVHLRAVPAPGAVRLAGGRLVHLEGLDAVAAPDRLAGQGGGNSSNDGGDVAAAQDASQEGQVCRNDESGAETRCPKYVV